MGAQAASQARVESLTPQLHVPANLAPTGGSSPQSSPPPISDPAAAGVPAQLPALAPTGGLSLLVQGKARSNPPHNAEGAAAVADAASGVGDTTGVSPSARSATSSGTARLSRSVVATMALTTVDLMTATNRRVCHFTLSRPGEPAAHIIPPLMGMQWKFRCDGCNHILFMSSSIVRPSKRSRQDNWLEGEAGGSDSDRRPLTARHDRRAFSATAPTIARLRGNSGGDSTASAAASAVAQSARSPPALASTPRAGRRSGGRLTGLGSPGALTAASVDLSSPASITSTSSAQQASPRTAPSLSVPRVGEPSAAAGALSPVMETSASVSRSNSSLADSSAGAHATPLPSSGRAKALQLPSVAHSGSDSLDALLASPRGEAVKATTTESSTGAVSCVSSVVSRSNTGGSPGGAVVSSQASALSPASTLKASGASIITSAVVSTSPIQPLGTTPTQPLYGRRQSNSTSPAVPDTPGGSLGGKNTSSARPSSSKLSPRGEATSLKSTGSFHVSMQSPNTETASSSRNATPSFTPAAAWGTSTSAVPPSTTRNSSTRKGGFSFDDDAFGSDAAEASPSSQGGLQPIVGLATGVDTGAAAGGNGGFSGFGGSSGRTSDSDAGEQEVDVWALAPLAEDGAPLTPSGASRNRTGFGFDAAAGDATAAAGPPAPLDVFGRAIKAPVVVDYSKRSGWKSTIAFDRGERWDPEDKRRANQVIDPSDKESLKARLRMLQQLAESEDVTHAETAAATGAAAAAAAASDEEAGDVDSALGDVLCEGAEVQPLGSLASPVGDDVSLASPRSMPSLTSKKRPSTATRKRAADASLIVDEDLDASSFVVAGDVLFLEPLDWMGEMPGQMGHLRCPCCDAMLGFYDWAGAVVGTRAKVSPAFCVYTQAVWVQRPPAVASDQTLAPSNSPANVMTHSVSMPEGPASPPRIAANPQGKAIPGALQTSASIAV